jgi:hypothetical protein
MIYNAKVHNIELSSRADYRQLRLDLHTGLIDPDRVLAVCSTTRQSFPIESCSESGHTFCNNP